MKSKFLLFSVVFLLAGLISLPSVLGDTVVSGCAEITSGGNYVMNQSILNANSLEFCIKIKADNVVFDCDGFSIEADGVKRYAMYIEKGGSSTLYNITVKNCILSKWKGNMYIDKTDNSSFENLSIINSSEVGISLLFSSYNNFTDIDVISNAHDGIALSDGQYNSFKNILAKSNNYGFMLMNAKGNTITDSIIQDSLNKGILIHGALSSPHTIYNNLFNNSNNFALYTANIWNTTRQAGTRVYSGGDMIGGNYWTNPTGNGYSDTCVDADKDGFCDVSYTLDGSNMDYLPLSDEVDVTSPLIALNSPSDGSASIDSTPDCNFTATDETVLTMNCTLWMGGTAYGDVSASNDTETTITANASWSLGNHEWYVNCSDGTNEGKSNIFNLEIIEATETIGTTYPMLWVLPIFFTLFILYGIFESLVRKKDLTVEELLKVFFLTAMTVVFIMAITGVL